MRSISANKYEIVFGEILNMGDQYLSTKNNGICESLKLRNQETKKLSNQETNKKPTHAPLRFDY